jgi:hypothetical protein
LGIYVDLIRLLLLSSARILCSPVLVNEPLLLGISPSQMVSSSPLGGMIATICILLLSMAIMIGVVTADCSSTRAAHNFSIGLFVNPTSPHVANAVDLAIKQINGNGMLGDDMLVLTNTIQTPCDTVGAATLANSMIASGVDVVVGPSCSSVVEIVAPIMTNANIPQITVDATSPSLFVKADYPMTIMMVHLSYLFVARVYSCPFLDHIALK